MRLLTNLIAMVFCLGILPTGQVVLAQTSDAEAVRAVGEKWRTLYAEGRYAEIPELYSEDTLVLPRGRPIVAGRDGMRRAVGGLAAGRKVDISLTERELMVEGDLAWIISDFTVRYTSPDGTVSDPEFGRSMILFKRDADGEWRIHRDMDSPAPGPIPTGLDQAPPVWDGSERTEVTECDRWASSRYVRQRLAPPKSRSEIDVPSAIAQCLADLGTYPNDARILFHLGRLYGYTEDRDLAHFYRQQSAMAGNHNAIFLLAYLDLVTAKDDAVRCDAMGRIVDAARRGNYSAQMTFAAYHTDGRSDGCGKLANDEEIVAFVASAKSQADGFFETLLASHLERLTEQNN